MPKGPTIDRVGINEHNSDTKKSEVREGYQTAALKTAELRGYTTTEEETKTEQHLARANLKKIIHEADKAREEELQEKSKRCRTRGRRQSNRILQNNDRTRTL